MYINYDHYRIFYYVAKYGNVSQAAKLLLNNQPNLTRTIKTLEGELGCPLFLRYLESMLKTAIIVDDSSKDDEVGINNTVELYMEDDDEVETYRLVTSVRGSSIQGLISIDSPLGKAILGHKLNDRVYIQVNDNFGYYAIIKKIINTQNDENDELRKF